MPRLLLALLAIFPVSAQLLIDTYAGGVARTGVPAQNVAVGYTPSITWDPSGNVVFCDQTYNVIRRVRADGILETIAGTGVDGFAGDGGPAVNALINSPLLAHYDASGNLYFFDQGNFRIRRIDATGIISTIAGNGEPNITQSGAAGSALSVPIPGLYDLAVDPAGNVYFTEGNDARIFRVTASGKLELLVQLTTTLTPSVYGTLATDSHGNVYWFLNSSDAYPPRTLLQISPAGVLSIFATMSSPASVASDFAGNIYVISGDLLYRFAADGTSTATASPIGGYPSPLAVDAHGNLAFVSQIPVPAGFKIIQEFTGQTGLVTVAGANPQSAPDGTPLPNAWFIGPLNFAFSHAGDLYIADHGACQIRKISLAGILSTFAGSGTCGSAPPSGNAKTANLVYPDSIAIDSKDNIWVTDDSSNLYSIAPDGTISNMAQITAGPAQLAIDAQDRIYILTERSLTRRLSDGAYQSIIAPSAGILAAIAADAAGNVCFGLLTAPGLYIVNDDATFTLKFPSFPTSLGLAFDPSGNPWGSDGLLTTANSSGIASVGAIGAQGFSGDGGPAQSASMRADGSMAFGPDGNLYFLDNMTRIRRIAGAGPSTAPVISQGGIVNAISYAGGSIAPGELISIFGTNFGATGLQVNPAENNSIPFTIGRTKVLFNGSPGAITAITPTQINVFVPYEVATPVSVQVQVDNILSAPVTIPVAATAPGLSPSILNQDGTLNSAANPAPRGSIVSFFGTGLGAMAPQLNDGNLAISTPYSIPVNSPTMTINGQPASILYAGDAPTLPTGVFQINAAIPANINPGVASVLLTIGGASTQVTVAVK